MNDTITLPEILTQQEFDEYSAKWLSVASGEGGSELEQAFLNSNTERVLHLRFPIERITWLVSAVGVRKIKARFLLVPDNGQLHFTVALFATDDKAERLSAYYLPQPYWADNSAPATVGDPIPQNLATTWLANWKAADKVTPALFATQWGPLQGYNFEIKDFVSSLFAAQSFQSKEIYIGFGLHQYYAPAATDGSLTETFGLVLQLPEAGQTKVPAADDTFFDMAFPYPPNT